MSGSRAPGSGGTASAGPGRQVPRSGSLPHSMSPQPSSLGEPTGFQWAGASDNNTPADVPSRDCRSFAVVSPGMSGQTTAGKRAPMLGKWPIPNKLSTKPAQAGGLWIRRVLVRAQEGQLRSAGQLTRVSEPADFVSVCYCSVPTHVAGCPPHSSHQTESLESPEFE